MLHVGKPMFGWRWIPWFLSEAAQNTSDFDLHLYTSKDLTRPMRTEFQNVLVEALPKWRLLPTGDRCIKIGHGRVSVDIAFRNTNFDCGKWISGENDLFFDYNPKARLAVRVLKYCFRDVKGLCGFHLEKLVMATQARCIVLSAQYLYEMMLRQLHSNGTALQEVRQNILEGAADGTKLDKQIQRMKNVIETARIFESWASIGFFGLSSWHLHELVGLLTSSPYLDVARDTNQLQQLPSGIFGANMRSKRSRSPRAEIARNTRTLVRPNYWEATAQKTDFL